MISIVVDDRVKYQRQAGIKKREAEELVRQADALSVKALESQASGRK